MTDTTDSVTDAGNFVHTESGVSDGAEPSGVRQSLNRRTLITAIGGLSLTWLLGNTASAAQASESETFAADADVRPKAAEFGLEEAHGQATIVAAVRGTLKGDTWIVAGPVFQPEAGFGPRIYSAKNRDGVQENDRPDSQGNDDKQADVVTGHAHFITALAANRSGKTCISGGFDKTLKSWTILSDYSGDGRNRRLVLQETHRFKAHSKPILSVAVHPHPEETLCVSGGADNRLFLWDYSSINESDGAASRKVVNPNLEGPFGGSVPDYVPALFGVDGGVLDPAKLFGPETAGRITAVEFQPYGTQIGAISSAGYFYLFAAGAASPRHYVSQGRMELQLGSGVAPTSLLMGWNTVIIGAEDGQLYRIALPKPGSKLPVSFQKASISQSSSSDSGPLAALAGTWHTKAITVLEAIEVTRQDRFTFLSGGDDQSLVLWTVDSSGDKLHSQTITHFDDPITSLAYDPDSGKVAVGLASSAKLNAVLLDKEALAAGR